MPLVTGHSLDPSELGDMMANAESLFTRDCRFRWLAQLPQPPDSPSTGSESISPVSNATRIDQQLTDLSRRCLPAPEFLAADLALRGVTLFS